MALDTASAAGRPNILIILADDVGFSDIGAYGSEIRTPTLDGLANESGVFTNFHSTPLCAPSRAELLTGADHHLVGVGALLHPILPYQTGEDYGGLNRKARTIAQILLEAGYHTYMSGKWHLSEQGPEKWGFEKSFYLQPDAGAANNFAPIQGQANGADEKHYEDGIAVGVTANFFSSDNYTSHLIHYINGHRADGRPFFAYLAFQATHNPLQAPEKYLEHYRGIYDAGYDAIRAQRIRRQKEFGLIPQDFLPSPGLPVTALSPSSPSVLINAPWSALTANQKRREARQMEIYAGMLENMDHNIGLLLNDLRAHGEYEHTLIVFLSDNGPDGNGDLTPSGYVDNSLDNYGKPGSYVTRSVGWSLVSSAPFKGFKASIYEGGTSVPSIVRLPGAGTSRRIIAGLASLVDIVPTILATIGIAKPDTHYRDREVAPLEGFSLLAALRGDSNVIRGPNDVLADEMYNHRYVVRGDYKLERTDPLYYGWSLLADHAWQLFNIRADRGETKVLSERSATFSTKGNSNDPNSKIMDGLLDDWADYVRRTGLSLPPWQRP